ncbi:hypothetical protein LINPERHAP2_LOCUS42503, partial [Linum perenne]
LPFEGHLAVYCSNQDRLLLLANFPQKGGYNRQLTDEGFLLSQQSLVSTQFITFHSRPPSLKCLGFYPRVERVELSLELLCYHEGPHACCILVHLERVKRSNLSGGCLHAGFNLSHNLLLCW